MSSSSFSRYQANTSFYRTFNLKPFPSPPRVLLTESSFETEISSPFSLISCAKATMPSQRTEDSTFPGQTSPESLNDGNLWPLMNMNIQVSSTPSQASTAPIMTNYAATLDAPLQSLYEAFHNPSSNADVQTPHSHIGHAYHTVSEIHQVSRTSIESCPSKIGY